MSTLGVRGGLAAVLLVSLGLLAGTSQGAGIAPAPDLPDDAPGVFDRLQAIACEVNHAATTGDASAGTAARRESCRRRHGLE